MSLTQSIISIIATYIILFPLITGIIRRKEIFTYDLKIMYWHLITSSMIEVLNTILWYLQINNLFTMHIYVLEFVTIISLYYASIMSETIKLKTVFIIIGAFWLFAIINAIFWQPLTINPSNAMIVGYSMVTCFIFFSIYERSKQIAPERLNNIMDYNINKIPFFFINTGLIIYCIGTPVIFSISNRLFDEKFRSIRLDIWTIHAILFIIMNICIGIGFLKFKRHKKNTDIVLDKIINEAFEEVGKNKY